MYVVCNEIVMKCPLRRRSLPYCDGGIWKTQMEWFSRAKAAVRSTTTLPAMLIRNRSLERRREGGREERKGPKPVVLKASNSNLF